METDRDFQEPWTLTFPMGKRADSSCMSTTARAYFVYADGSR